MHDDTFCSLLAVVLFLGVIYVNVSFIREADGVSGTSIKELLLVQSFILVFMAGIFLFNHLFR